MKFKHFPSCDSNTVIIKQYNENSNFVNENSNSNFDTCYHQVSIPQAKHICESPIQYLTHSESLKLFKDKKLKKN